MSVPVSASDEHMRAWMSEGMGYKAAHQATADIRKLESEHAEMLALLRYCVNTWGVPLDQSVGDVGDPVVPLGVPIAREHHAQLSELLTRIDGGGK